jgi:hypothetical protein
LDGPTNNKIEKRNEEKNKGMKNQKFSALKSKLTNMKRQNYHTSSASGTVESRSIVFEGSGENKL